MWPERAKSFQYKTKSEVAMRRAKPFVEPLSEDAIRRQLKKLVKEGKLPSLEDLCAAVLETRKNYAIKIRRARRESQHNVVVN
jgi:hypothetical protein